MEGAFCSISPKLAEFKTLSLLGLVNASTLSLMSTCVFRSTLALEAGEFVVDGRRDVAIP